MKYVNPYTKAVATLVCGVAMGYYATPQKIKIETRVIEVEKKTESTKTRTTKDKRKETVVTKPDGTVIKTVEDSTTNRDTESDKEEQRKRLENKSEERSREGRLISLSLLTGVPISLSSGVGFGSIVYGLHGSATVLGPISLGVWGLSNASGGFSLGVNF